VSALVADLAATTIAIGGSIRIYVNCAHRRSHWALLKQEVSEIRLISCLARRTPHLTVIHTHPPTHHTPPLENGKESETVRERGVRGGSDRVPPFILGVKRVLKELLGCFLCLPHGCTT
jgi:hypothetical protein